MICNVRKKPSTTLSAIIRTVTSALLTVVSHAQVSSWTKDGCLYFIYQSGFTWMRNMVIRSSKLLTACQNLLPWWFVVTLLVRHLVTYPESVRFVISILFTCHYKRGTHPPHPLQKSDVLLHHPLTSYVPRDHQT